MKFEGRGSGAGVPASASAGDVFIL